MLANYISSLNLLLLWPRFTKACDHLTTFLEESMVILQVRTLLTKSISALGCALLVMLLACGSAAAQVIEIRPDSPSQYAVVRGDTLWDIAGKFLAEPWLWPQVGN